MTSGLAQSVQVRLVRHAKKLGVDPNLVLARYASERLLYRLSQSQHADRFVLKGALLMLVWLGENIRPTRDVDLLGFGDLAADTLTATFAEICAVPAESDGLSFDAASIRVVALRAEDAYGGMRVTLLAHLGPARLRVQVDVGIGDAVSPEPEWLEYPSLLDLPRPKLRAYCPETAIAEKTHAMVVLGSKNSRMRDFFDVYALSMRAPFDGERLSRALRATFERRRTVVPAETPIAFSTQFAEVEGKVSQWADFVVGVGRRRHPPTWSPSSMELLPSLAPCSRQSALANGSREGGRPAARGCGQCDAGDQRRARAERALHSYKSRGRWQAAGGAASVRVLAEEQLDPEAGEDAAFAAVLALEARPGVAGGEVAEEPGAADRHAEDDLRPVLAQGNVGRRLPRTKAW